MLATFLWPEFADRRGKVALRRTLSALKKAIGDQALAISRDTLGVQPENLWCDVLAFQDAVKAVNRHDHAQSPCDNCLRHMEMAVSLYRDDFLTGFSLCDSLPFDDWHLQQTEYLRRQLAGMLQHPLLARIAQGRLEESIPIAHRWLRIDPLREEAHRQLIQLYAWTGKRSAALKQYQECVRILEEELGVPPLAETKALYQAVLEDRLAMPAASIPPTPTPVTDTRRATPIPFVGRKRELALMGEVYRQVGSDGRFLTVAGEAGIGKTRLVERFLSGLPGAMQLRGRCYTAEAHLTYAPFAAALRPGLKLPDAKGRLRRYDHRQCPASTAEPGAA